MALSTSPCQIRGVYAIEAAQPICLNVTANSRFEGRGYVDSERQIASRRLLRTVLPMTRLSQNCRVEMLNNVLGQD